MLFEGEFYEDGQTIAKRIEELAAKVKVADLAGSRLWRRGTPAISATSRSCC